MAKNCGIRRFVGIERSVCERLLTQARRRHEGRVLPWLFGWLTCNRANMVVPRDRLGSGAQTVTCVVAVSYSPTPSQVQYHRRLRA